MATTPSLTSIGLSALRAAQASLSTTGNNIANVNTDGYSRQRVELATAGSQDLVGFSFGTGVQIQAVSRFADQTVNKQLLVQTSNAGDASKFLEFVSLIDNLLADPNAGLSPAVDGFFASMQDLAGDPASPLHRQVLLTEANTLSQRFRLIDERLSEVDDRVNSTVRASVTEINSLAESIGDLNGRITASLARSGQPNELLDQRDQLLRQIGNQVSISTVELDDGSINVTAGGKGLVLGSIVTSLELTKDTFDATRLEVAHSNGFNISSRLRGGELGAALRFRAEILDPTQNALGRVAAGLTESFNAQHQLGLDASGNLGAGFFVPGQASVVANANNAGGALSAVITDVSALTTSNYTLTALGGNAYSLVRDSDDQTTAINTAGVTPFTATTIDGFDLTITAGAALGDTFQIRPVSAHAGTMKVNLTDPTTIATAAPVRALTAFANTGSANLGSVEINSRANLPLTGAPVNGQIDITFSSATNQLTLVPDPLGEGPLAFDPSVDSAGKNFSILGGDISFRFSGTPGNADTFVLEHNSGGVGDNRNALALSNIQDQSLLGASTATLQQAYGQAVTDVGERTRDGQITDGAFSALLEQATADRDRISGVNLDEEAADLVRFQQAYQASARLITVVDELFQTIINSLR